MKLSAIRLPACATPVNGPKNISRLRRFAVGIIKKKGARSVARKIRQLTQNTRAVFDYLGLTALQCGYSCSASLLDEFVILRAYVTEV